MKKETLMRATAMLLTAALVAGGVGVAPSAQRSYAVEAAKATATEAAKETEQKTVTSGTESDKQSYAKFASDEFILWWFGEASDEDKEAWYDSVSKYDGEKATATEAKYPS